MPVLFFGALLLVARPGITEAADAPAAQSPRSDTGPAQEPSAEAFSVTARSTVFVQVRVDDRRVRYGEGVILRLRDGTATIATARHVVDVGFAATAQTTGAPKPVSIRFAGGEPVPANVEWMAPHGEDLALLSAPVRDPQAREAAVSGRRELKAGDSVWMLQRRPASGNGAGNASQPQASRQASTGSPADVSTKKGTITGVRDVVQDGYAFHLLQSDLGVGPGDSGSGLYDADGRLLAIQTMRALTPPGSGPAVSFSLPVQVLLDLAREKLPAEAAPGPR